MLPKAVGLTCSGYRGILLYTAKSPSQSLKAQATQVHGPICTGIFYRDTIYCTDTCSYWGAA